MLVEKEGKKRVQQGGDEIKIVHMLVFNWLQDSRLYMDKGLNKFTWHK